MRTRSFLRTTEFLWQEGHTVHETEAESPQNQADARHVRNLCARTLRDCPIRGSEIGQRKIPWRGGNDGAQAMVQDRKEFKRAHRIFSGRILAVLAEFSFRQFHEGKQEFGWTTSWRGTERMVGTVVMAHGDDDGVVLPPRIAPTHIVILPITPKEETSARVLETARGSLRSYERKDFSMMWRFSLKSIGAISAVELRIGTGSRKVYRCELRSDRIIRKKIR